MKRVFVFILVLTLLVTLIGCGSSQTGSPSQDTTSMPGASSTSLPDYANTDFSGHWTVSEVYDASGQPVTGSALEVLDADFTLELLTDNVYFVYDSAGAVLGQGGYTVSSDTMTLEAGGVQTVYTIADKDTLRGTAADSSVTVLKRQPEEEPTVKPEEEPDVTDTDIPDETVMPGEDEGETDIPDESTAPVNTATPEASADVTSTATVN